MLTGFGVGVIGLVDNFLRPVLVGRDTKLPDYLVLLSTLGGVALFGINGFVIGPLLAACLWLSGRSSSGISIPLKRQNDLQPNRLDII